MVADPKFFAQILEEIPDSVTVQDRDFRIVYQNAAIREAFGSHLGQECFRVYEGRDQVCEDCGLERVFASGKPAQVLRRVTREDGNTTYWENTCLPLFDQNGEITAGVEVCRDVTARVSLEAEVNEHNSKLIQLNREYRTLLDHLPVFIVRYDRELRRTYVNPAWESAAGLTAADCVGVDPEQIPKVKRPLNEKYLQKLRQVLATGRSQYCAFEWENAFGQLLYFEYEIIPECGPDGQVVSVLAVGRDLTGHRDAENALQQERSLLRCIIDSASDLIFVKDRKSRYLVCNKASEAFIGLPEAEQIGKSDYDFFPSEMAEWVQDQDRQVIEQGLPQQTEEWVSYPDGRRVLFDTLKFPFVGPRGEIDGLVGICRDITARKQVEEALCQQQRHSHSLLRLSRRLESAQSYPEVLAAARDEVRQIVGYTSLWVYLFSDDLRYADVLAAEGPTADSILSLENVVRLTIAGDPMLEEIAAAEHPVVVEDARTDPRTDKDIVERLGNRTIINIPIILFDRHLGTIGTGTFGDEGIRVPTAAERDYLEALASHMAVALDRIRLLAESRKAEEDLRQLNRKLRAISNCNQLLMRVEDEQYLLDEVCRIICEEAGYLLAWVGYAENDADKTIRPMAWAGQGSDHIAQIQASWAEDGAQWGGPAGAAIRSGETICVQDIATDNRMEPWRENALQRGYRAGMALPLKGQKDRVFGVLLVYYGMPDSITPDEIELLEELAGDLAFGVTVLRERTAQAEAQRQISLLSFALDSVHEGAFLVDRAGFMKYVNDEACRSLGYSRDELLELSVFDIDPDLTESRWLSFVEEEDLSGTLTFETRHRSKDGRVFPVEINTNKLEFEGVEYGLAMARDISARKLIESALYFVAERGWLTDEESFFDALARFLGESLDMDYVVIDQLSERPGFAETLALYARGSIVPNMSYPLKGTPCEKVMGQRLCVYPQGVQRLFPEDSLLVEMGVESYIGIPLWDSAGQAIGLIALMNSRQVSDDKPATQLLQLVALRAAAELERTRSEDLLRQREREFRTLAENSPDNIARYDTDCRTVYVNPALARTLGGSAAEMLDATPVENPRIDEVREYQEKIAEVLRTGEASEMDLVLPDQRGGSIYHNIRFTAERGGDGAITGVLAIGRDITDRRQAEEERKANLRFFEGMDRVNRAIQKAADPEQMMGEVLEAVRDILDCDRAYLLYPCDPAAEEWSIPMERTRPEYPGALAEGLAIPRDPGMSRKLQCLLSSEGATQFGPGTANPVPPEVAKRYSFQSCMAMTIRTGLGVPWEFGIHQCSQVRQWTVDEERLFEAIGRRLSDALTSQLSSRDLQESEEKYRRIVDTANEGIWVLDSEGLTTFVNPRMTEMLGYPQNEMLGRPMADFMLDEDISDHFRRLENRRQGIAENYERRFRCRDEQLIWTHASATPIFDHQQNFLGAFGMFTDITEGKRAETALRENREFLDNIVEHLPSMLFVKDAATLNFVRFNKAGEELLGYRREELLGKNDYDFFPTEIADFFTTNDRRALESRLPVDIPEERIQLRNGEERILHTQKIPLFDDNGEPQYLLGISEDITAQKRVAAELRKLNKAIEQSPASIVLTDAEGQIKYVNAKFCEITGYKRREVLGQSPRILKSGATSDADYKKLWNTITAGGVWSGEFHNLKKNGELFWEHATIAPIRDTDGEISHFVALKEDITERKRLEEQLRQSQKMESVGTLAGGIAHDFNNMLAVILGRTQLALRKIPAEDPLHASLREIQKAAGFSADLTRQLLAFARKQVISPRVIDLNEALEGMLKMLRRLIGEDIDLTWVPASRTLPVNMDPSQLNQVLVNLCVNSRDAISGTGNIRISTHHQAVDAAFCLRHAESRPGDYVVMEVSDNGSGMGPATLDKIFDPFFTTKEIGRGTGLGLSTVYGIIKQNQGFILVDSAPQKGTTFRLFLPSRNENAQSEERAPADAGLPHGDETILLVEDEESLLDMTREILEECGYRVLTAQHPDQALRIADDSDGGIDLLITDMVMPGMNGQALADRLKQISPRTRTLFMSGYATDVLSDSHQIDPNFSLIQKPFTVGELVARVRSVLDEAQE